MVAGLDQILSEVVRRVGQAAAIAVAAATLAGCDSPAATTHTRSARASAEKHPPGYVIDSVLPPGEALRRFRVGLDSPAALAGPRSRDELVNRFFAAMRRKDRSALESLAIDRAEFAYLVFPASKWSKMPYNQPADVAWLLFQAKSGSGLTRLVGRADGFAPQGYRCARQPDTDGPLRLWAHCVVRVREGGSERDVRLFGTIVERDGRYKFAGYNSDR